MTTHRIEIQLNQMIEELCYLNEALIAQNDEGLLYAELKLATATEAIEDLRKAFKRGDWFVSCEPLEQEQSK